MPGFKVHITASTALGIGYGVGAATLYDVPLPTAALATTLCSVSGMLPDLDSGPGRPLHESVSFAAAAIPMMMVDRFRHWGWTHESMILAGAAIYLFIRFGVGHMLKKWTVHRGIFHSFPVALVFTELAFLVCTTGDLHMRYFKAGGISIGFLSHLILDEIWSVDFKHAKLKSSFGTALKFWAPCWWANGLAYSIMVGTTLLALKDPIWIQAGGEGEELHEIATSILKEFAGNSPAAAGDPNANSDPNATADASQSAAADERVAIPQEQPDPRYGNYGATQPQAAPYVPPPRIVDRPAAYRTAQPGYGAQQGYGGQPGYGAQPGYGQPANNNGGWNQPVDMANQPGNQR